MPKNTLHLLQIQGGGGQNYQSRYIELQTVTWAPSFPAYMYMYVNPSYVNVRRVHIRYQFIYMSGCDQEMWYVYVT